MMTDTEVREKRGDGDPETQRQRDRDRGTEPAARVVLGGGGQDTGTWPALVKGVRWEPQRGNLRTDLG